MTRTVACVDAKLQAAPAGACKGLTVPLAHSACNTAPCVGHSWQVSSLLSRPGMGTHGQFLKVHEMALPSVG